MNQWGDKMEEKKLIQASASILAKAALNLFVADQHRWSTRPCSTCRIISELLGESWGCILYAETKNKGAGEIN